MKLVGELKKKVENAATLEEKRDAIAKAGIELNDAELNKVAGGGCALSDDDKKEDKPSSGRKGHPKIDP